MSVVYSTAKDTYSNYLDTGYFESDNFGQYIMNTLSTEIYNLIHKDPELYMVTTDGNRIYQYRNYYYKDNTRRNLFSLKNCDFVILYKPTGKIETSIDVNENNSSIESLLSYIDTKEGEKIYISEGKMQKGPVSIKDKWEHYKDYFVGSYYYTNGKYYDSKGDYEKSLGDYGLSIEDNEKSELGYKFKTENTDTIVNMNDTEYTNSKYVEYNIDDFDIYITYEKEFELNSYDTYNLGVVKTLSGYEDVLYIAVPICAIMTCVIIIYLIISIGYKKEKEGVDLNDIDKIPLEIVLAIIITVITIVMAIITNFYSTRPEYYKLYISGIITVYFIIYIMFAIGITTIIKRIKAKTFIRNTITWRALKLCKKLLIKLKEFVNNFTAKLKTTWKVTLGIIAYILLMLIILMFFGGRGEVETGVMFDTVITTVLVYNIIKRLHNFERIKEQLKHIYEGNEREELNEEEFEADFKEMVRYINDISNGFENAVEEGIKSERLKTELITNVSHDIKTPLTSIINYVDLIKRENIENDKLKEYIEILEAKSHRLKRLTEDLVEASKASSGNVKLNLEKLNLAELINQTTGEFEDKFKEKGLQIITNMPEEEICIEADSRYMYRIIENVFSNVSKYALMGSRVYLDLTKTENIVRIEVKNISEAKLNISEDELMQRFVRGDKSRFTEGSGLRTINIKEFSRTSKRKIQYKNRWRSI